MRFDRTVAELAVDNPKTENLIDLEHVDDYEGLTTRVTVHETIRSNEVHRNDYVSPIIPHEQDYVEVRREKVVIHEYRTKNPFKLKICEVSGDDTKNKRTMDI